MPPRGLVLMSVSASLWWEELSTPWTVLVSACCQDNSYFSTNKVWTSTDWWIRCFPANSSVRMAARMPKYISLTHSVSLCLQIWLCQNLVKFNSQFVKLLVGPQSQTCLFQVKRILGFCCRYSPKILIWVTKKKGIYFPDWLFPSVSIDSYSAAGTTV